MLDYAERPAYSLSLSSHFLPSNPKQPSCETSLELRYPVSIMKLAFSAGLALGIVGLVTAQGDRLCKRRRNGMV